MSIIFWFFCVCMLLLALAFVITPVIRHHRIRSMGTRTEINIQVHKELLQNMENAYNEGHISEAVFKSARQELESDLLTDIVDKEQQGTNGKNMSIRTILANIIILPVFAVSLYLLLGDLEMLGNKPVAANQETPQGQMHSIEEMVEKLHERLQQNPDDGNGWHMLGRSYLVMNQYQDAVKAYDNARKILGDEPQLLADYSEALILANNNMLTMDAVKMVELALQGNPDQPKALWIAGYSSFEQGNIPMTLGYWERLLAQLSPGSGEYNSLMDNINQIREKAGMQLLTAATSAPDVGIPDGITVPAADHPESKKASVDVQVDLDASLSGKVNPDDTVFIFARASEGPRMPLAIVRKQVSDLPIKVTLDDSLAMSPAMSLSRFKNVVIGARVSRTGNAMPVSGDLTGSSTVLQVGNNSGVVVTIDTILP